MNKYRILLPENVTPFVVNHWLLNELHSAIVSGKREFIFDLSDVKFISPLSIPNLLSIGLIAKKSFNSPISLMIPYNIELLHFLFITDFFTYSDKFGLYEYDKDLVGGFLLEQNSNELVQTLFFPRNLDTYPQEDLELYIIRNLKKSYRILNEFTEEFFLTNEHIYVILSELCVNAIRHGQSHVFITTSLDKSTKYPKASIAISDTGIGYLKTIKTKPCEELNIFSSQDLNMEDGYSNAKAIFEAVFFRYERSKYGLIEILRSVIGKNGTVRIHSENTQVVFTHKNIFYYLENKKDSLMSAYNNFLEESSKKDLKVSPLRVTGYKLAGVHIEMEVPLK